MQSPTRAVGELLGYTGKSPLLRELRATAVRRIRETIATSNTVVEAAKALGVSLRTLRRWRSDHSELFSVSSTEHSEP